MSCLQLKFPRISDDELVRRAQRGAPRAFDELVARHRRHVYQLALRVTSNPHDAEEIVQDTLILLHRGLASFRGEAKFSTWLYSVTRNAALMHLRHWRRSDPLGDDEDQLEDDGDEHGEEWLARRQLVRTALDELSALPDEYRVPFVLRDVEGLSSRETAAAVGINVNLVRQRVFRARRMLRGRLRARIG
jgi:RNA polymerase sigma-70 factor (ECF subfamily)